MGVTIADCKKLLDDAAAIREQVRREVASLPIFDLVADDLATQPEGDFVRHVLERARGAVNQHAAQHGGESVLRTPS